MKGVRVGLGAGAAVAGVADGVGVDVGVLAATVGIGAGADDDTAQPVNIPMDTASAIAAADRCGSTPQSSLTVIPGV